MIGVIAGGLFAGWSSRSSLFSERYRRAAWPLYFAVILVASILRATL